MTETISALTLSLMATGRLSLSDAVTLYKAAGSCSAVIEARHDIRSIIPDASDRLVELMSSDLSTYFARAEAEQEWCQQNKVRILTISDTLATDTHPSCDDPHASGDVSSRVRECLYPSRLRECFDAPLTLFYRGKADLNARHIINIVGTRKCTPYGQDVIAHIVADLKKLCPDIVIVSGLAYGIDITAHRNALSHEIPTVGVVAHGQDTLYPSLHRNEANKMCLGNGGVLTEYFRGTRPEARNFLQRNRIIAGLSDATIVVESASHGGGLVTARVAADYGREVFAVPGPVNAEYSVGCNNLIRDNKASLITSAQDIVSAMQWGNEAILDKARQQGIEQELFPDLNTNETAIVDALSKNGDSTTNALATATSLSVSTIASTLFSLEMKGVIKALSGNTYHLIH